MSQNFHTLVERDSVVKLSYTLHAFDPTQQGEPLLIEERNQSNPFEFLMSQGWTHPKIEGRLLGQKPGFRDSLKLPPEEGYGQFDPSLLREMPIEKFPKDLELKMGMKFQTQGPGGKVISVIVKELKDEKVIIDGNHPLAGLGLIFDIELLQVRAPTPDEVTQKKALPLFH